MDFLQGEGYKIVRRDHLKLKFQSQYHFKRSLRQIHNVICLENVYSIAFCLPKSEKCAQLWHFQPIWLELNVKSLNGRTQHMFAIYRDFSMPTSQISLPTTQPSGLKVENRHKFGIFSPIWLKLVMEPLNGRTRRMIVIHKDSSKLTAKLTYHLTSLPTKSEKFAKLWFLTDLFETL